MEQFFQLYVLVMTALAGLLLAAWGGEVLRSRRHRCRDAVLRKKYLHIVMAALLSDDDVPPHFPLLRRAGARLVLAETLAGVVRSTCGLDDRALHRIVVSCNLDRWLYRRIRWSRGYRRARFLALSAALPAGAERAFRVARYRGSRCRDVRFCALLVQLSACPENALRWMAAYPDAFTDFELAEMLVLLRRGMLPIACEPLLEAANPNLRRVGLAIVRQFDVGEAMPQLLRMVAEERSPELGREVLYTLGSLRRRIVRSEAAGRIAAMSAPERRALLRFLVREGYSVAALRRLFGNDEAPYGEALVQSYKRYLACR